MRTELTPEESLGIIRGLKEPLASFALLIALLGRRSEEAAPLQPKDLDDECVLHFRRIIYKRRVVELNDEKQIHMPLDPNNDWHSELMRRLRKLSEEEMDFPEPCRNAYRS